MDGFRHEIMMSSAGHGREKSHGVARLQRMIPEYKLVVHGGPEIPRIETQRVGRIQLRIQRRGGFRRALNGFPGHATPVGEKPEVENVISLALVHGLTVDSQSSGVLALSRARGVTGMSRRHPWLSRILRGQR